MAKITGRDWFNKAAQDDSSIGRTSLKTADGLSISLKGSLEGDKVTRASLKTLTAQLGGGRTALPKELGLDLPVTAKRSLAVNSDLLCDLWDTLGTDGPEPKRRNRQGNGTVTDAANPAGTV